MKKMYLEVRVLGIEGNPIRIEVFPFDPTRFIGQWMVMFTPDWWQDIRYAEHRVVVSIGEMEEKREENGPEA